MPDSLRLRAAALSLVVPDHAVVVDRTAAWLHGVDALPRSAIHEMPALDVFSASGSRLRRPHVASGVRTMLPKDVQEVDGLRVTTPLRTACDLGRSLWRFDALGAIDGFLRQGLAKDELIDEISRFKGFRGVRQLRELAPLGDAGSESQPESALRLHWHDAGLPWPQTQIWVADDDGVLTFRIDLGHEEVRYGAEYFGEEFHGADRAQHDASRLQWLGERGWSMDVFLKDDVYGRDWSAPGRLRERFAQAVADRRRARATHIDVAR